MNTPAELRAHDLAATAEALRCVVYDALHDEYYTIPEITSTGGGCTALVLSIMDMYAVDGSDPVAVLVITDDNLGAPADWHAPIIATLSIGDAWEEGDYEAAIAMTWAADNADELALVLADDLAAYVAECADLANGGEA
jgi:hypothetical protein